MTPPAESHRVQLDGLRAFAIFAVFVEHWTPWGSAIRSALPWGSLGVRLFFVLSGFLITDILLRERARATEAGASRLVVLRQFMARRVLRIFPALYLVAISMAIFDLGASRETLPYTLTYTSNLRFAWLGTWPAAVAHFWSLGVEEQFYLLWPWLMLFVPVRRLGAVVTLALIAGLVSRLVAVLAGANQITAMCLPTSCLDTLGAGALLALGRHGFARGAAAWFASGRAAAFGLAIGSALWFYRGEAGTAAHNAMVVGLDVALALLFAPLVAASAAGLGGLAGRLLEWSPLVYVGRISYGLYLLHVIPSFIGWPPEVAAASAPLRFAGYFLVSLVAASLSWFCFEKPINDLKRRFPYVPAESTDIGR